MKTNYREIEFGCHNCKFCHRRDEGDWIALYCNQDGFAEYFPFEWFVFRSLTQEEQDDFYELEEEHKVYSTGICDEWEKIEEIYD